VKGDVQEVIDERTVDSILDDAGVDVAYVEELQEEMANMLSDRAKLDFFDNMKSLKSILAENIPSGLGYRKFLDQIGRSRAMSQIGLAGEKPYYIETVYRTNFGTARIAGRWKSAQRSPLVKMLQYMSVIDGRTTPICEQLAGTIKEKTDQFWDTYTPLNHFSCRSEIAELTESYVELNEIEERDPPGDPEAGGAITADHPKDFRTNPGQSDAWMKSTKGMKQRLKEYES